MKYKTNFAARSSAKLTDDVDILAVERDTEEFSAHLKAIQPQMDYIRRLAGREANHTHHVLYRYVELMRISRPAVTVEEANVLLEAMDRGSGPFLHSVEGLKEYFCVVVEGWYGYLGLFRNWTPERDRFLKKLRSMPELALCSLVDSVAQVLNAEHRGDLGNYFNLTTERGVPWNG